MMHGNPNIKFYIQGWLQRNVEGTSVNKGYRFIASY